MASLGYNESVVKNGCISQSGNGITWYNIHDTAYMTTVTEAEYKSEP